MQEVKPEENGGVKEIPDNPAQWISVAEAARLLDCTAQTVYNHVKAGRLVAAETATGAKVVLLAEVRALANGAKEPSMSVRLLSHVEKLTHDKQGVVEDYRHLVSDQRTELVELRKRCAELEGMVSKVFLRQARVAALHEDLISLKHTRDIEFETAKADRERLDKGVATVRAWAPAIARKLGFDIPGVSDSAGPIVDALCALRDSLGREKIEALKAVLEPHEAATFTALLAVLPKAQSSPQ